MGEWLAVEVDPLLDWGLPLLRFVNDLPTWLGPLFEAATFLGSVAGLTIVAAVLLWSVDASLGWRVVLALLVYGSLNTPLKVAFGLPRPYWVLPDITARAAESSYGMPSGHAGFSMAVLGRAGAGLDGRTASITAGVLIVLVGTSRMYLGVHWPTDVLGGLVAGGLLLLVLLRTEPWLSRRLGHEPLDVQLAVAVSAALALLALVVAVAVLTAGQEVPQEWAELAAMALPDGELPAPRELAGPIGSTGALAGFAVGWLVLRHRGGYDAGGPVGKRLARLPIGLAGAALLFGGAEVEPATQSGVGSLLLTWLRYAAAGAWTGWGAPTLFVRVGLAERNRPLGHGGSPADGV